MKNKKRTGKIKGVENKNSKYFDNTYVTMAQTDPAARTKAGNVNIPSESAVEELRDFCQENKK